MKSFIEGINAIQQDVWAMLIIALGIVLGIVLRNNHDAFALAESVVAGGLMAFRGSIKQS